MRLQSQLQLRFRSPGADGLNRCTAKAADRCAAVRSAPVGVHRRCRRGGFTGVYRGLEHLLVFLGDSGANVRLGSSRLGSPTCTASTTVGPRLMSPRVLSVKCNACRLRSSASLSAMAACVGLGYRAVHRHQPVARILNMRRHGIARNHLGVSRRGAILVHVTSRSRMAPGKSGAIWTSCASPA